MDNELNVERRNEGNVDIAEVVYKQRKFPDCTGDTKDTEKDFT
jgi:hypothetical protein